MKKKNIFALVLILLPFAGSLLGMENSFYHAGGPSDLSSLTGRDKLLYLIQCLDVEGVRNFLEQNSIDLNYVDQWYPETCLALVAREDDERALAIADLLLKKGANIDQWGFMHDGNLGFDTSPLIQSMKGKYDPKLQKWVVRNHAMLKFLLKRGVRLDLPYHWNGCSTWYKGPLIMVLFGGLIGNIISWDESGNPIFRESRRDLTFNQRIVQSFKERIKLLLEHGTPIPRMYGWVPDQYVDFVNKIIKEINDERLENRKSCQALGLYHSTMENFKDPVLQTLQNVLGCKEDKPDLPLIPKEQEQECREADDGTVWVPVV